jgi:hypothetical protein
MRHDDLDYNAIQRRVTERVQRRYRFFLHTAVFIIGIPIIGQWRVAWLFLLWGLGWLVHLLWVSYHHHLEKAIAAEIEQEQSRIQKRKRDEIDHLQRIRDIEAADEAIAYDDDYAPRQKSPYPPDDSNGHTYPDWLGDDGELRDYDGFSDYDRQR